MTDRTLTFSPTTSDAAHLRAELRKVLASMATRNFDVLEVDINLGGQVLLDVVEEMRGNMIERLQAMKIRGRKGKIPEGWS